MRCEALIRDVLQDLDMVPHDEIFLWLHVALQKKISHRAPEKTTFKMFIHLINISIVDFVLWASYALFTALSDWLKQSKASLEESLQVTLLHVLCQSHVTVVDVCMTHLKLTDTIFDL